MMPTLLFLVSGLSLLTFQNVLRGLSQIAKGYAKQGAPAIIVEFCCRHLAPARRARRAPRAHAAVAGRTPLCRVYVC